MTQICWKSSYFWIYTDQTPLPTAALFKINWFNFQNSRACPSLFLLMNTSWCPPTQEYWTHWTDNPWSHQRHLRLHNNNIDSLGGKLVSVSFCTDKGHFFLRLKCCISIAASHSSSDADEFQNVMGRCKKPPLNCIKHYLIQRYKWTSVNGLNILQRKLLWYSSLIIKPMKNKQA